MKFEWVKYKKGKMAYDIGYILQSWANYGVFDYLLPFLLIFAVVFGILTAINIFRGNRTVDAIVAVVVGLLSLQWGFVPKFFSEVFPRAGVGLAVILVVIILAGFFIDPHRAWIMYIMLGIGAVAALVVLINTSDNLGWYSSGWISDNLPLIVGGLVVVVLLAIIVGSTRSGTHDAYVLDPWRGEGAPTRAH